MSTQAKPSFGSGIAVWCSLASRMLGWRPAEFWQATPAELIAAIRDPADPGKTSAPSRDLIAQMLERDKYG